jgi:putative protease
MKSSCYVGAVVNAYRMALDSYFSNPSAYTYDSKWLDELKSVSHRQYDTGFFFGEVGDKAKICDEPGYIKEQAALGVCYKYDENEGRAYFTQKNKFSAGERVELLVPGKTGNSFVCEKIYDEDGSEIDSVPHPMMNFAIDVPFNVPEFSILRYAK